MNLSFFQKSKLQIFYHSFFQFYRKRDSALCEKHAHHALLEALSQKDGARAEELMQSHLVDLVSALDLREKVSNPTKLKDVLGGLGA